MLEQKIFLLGSYTKCFRMKFKLKLIWLIFFLAVAVQNLEIVEVILVAVVVIVAVEDLTVPKHTQHQLQNATREKAIKLKK